MATATKLKPTKIETLRRMVSRPNGAKLSALCKATGWQVHSVRAAVSALRKSGLNVERTGSGASATYRVVSPETQDA